MAWFKKKKPAEPAEPTAHEKAANEMTEFEAQDEVPRNPRDWPKGKMVYLTYGNEGDDRYGDGATSKLGPAEVTHNYDGTVSVGGEVVDNPEDYKGKPITGGIIDQLTKHAERNKELREQEEKDGRAP